MGEGREEEGGEREVEREVKRGRKERGEGGERYRAGGRERKRGREREVEGCGGMWREEERERERERGRRAGGCHVRQRRPAQRTPPCSLCSGDIITKAITGPR